MERALAAFEKVGKRAGAAVSYKVARIDEIDDIDYRQDTHMRSGAVPPGDQRVRRERVDGRERRRPADAGARGGRGQRGALRRPARARAVRDRGRVGGRACGHARLRGAAHEPDRVCRGSWNNGARDRQQGRKGVRSRRVGGLGASTTTLLRARASTKLRSRWPVDRRREPAYGSVLYNLACCEALAGRKEDAIGHLGDRPRVGDQACASWRGKIRISIRARRPGLRRAGRLMAAGYKVSSLDDLDYWGYKETQTGRVRHGSASPRSESTRGLARTSATASSPSTLRIRKATRTSSTSSCAGARASRSAVTRSMRHRAR